jgi:hypothetical protein
LPSNTVDGIDARLVNSAALDMQSGEQITNLDDLQDIDELHVVEVTHHNCDHCPWT